MAYDSEQTAIINKLQCRKDMLCSMHASLHVISVVDPYRFNTDLDPRIRIFHGFGSLPIWIRIFPYRSFPIYLSGQLPLYV